MQFEIPQEVLGIIQTFKKHNFEIYIVGGAVRDLLTKRGVTDWDFATDAKPEEILQLFPDAFYDNIFGTVGIPAKEKGLKPHEITTFRREFGYSDTRRPDRVEWGKTLTEDLARRDFTINAMALHQTQSSKAKNWDVIDPYRGQEDLKKKLIRAVGDPQERFSEDALRMMRAVRIAAELRFTIEGKTLTAIRQNATLINKIAKERIKSELFKILLSPHPAEGIMKLKEGSLLAEILPELEKTFGVEQKSPQRHHIYDVGTHSIMSLKFCRSEDPLTRFAALIHDIGKPQTYKRLDNGVITFYNHEVVGTAIARRIAERLRFSKHETEKLLKLTRWHQFSVTEVQTDSAVRRFITHVGLKNINDMLELRRADRLGSGAKETSWRLEDFKKRLIEVQKQPFSIRDLKINGHDIMKLLNTPPSPKVGKILTQLFEEVVEKKVENEKQDLIKRVKAIA